MSKLPTSPLDPTRELFSYQQWRERFLAVVLQSSCVVGFIAIGLYLFSPSIPLYKVLAVLTYGVLVLITVLRSLPYRLRAGIFLFLLFAAGFTSMYDYGIADAAILFLGFLVMSGMLFAFRKGTYVLIIALIVGVLVMGWQEGLFTDAARQTAYFVVSASIVVIGLVTFQDEFTRTQASARETLDTLQMERVTLEQRVEERTAGLVRKTEFLRATSYIARLAAQAQDLPSLFNTLTDQITDQFGFYHTGLFLVSESGNQLVLQAASSEDGKRLLKQGYALSIGSDVIVSLVALQKKARIALDSGPDIVERPDPELPLTRSRIALPLLVRNRLVGVLDIQSDKPEAFSLDDLDVLQTLADQIAVTIENTRLLAESQQAIAQLEALSSARAYEVWKRKLLERSRAYTYTPLGLRAEKAKQNGNNSVSVPILLRGQKIGSITISRNDDGKWSKLDEALLQEVAGQVGLAVDNIRLLEEATYRAQQEQTVGQLATQFSQSLDLDTLLQTAARELGSLPDVAEVAVFVGHPDDQEPPAK